MWCAEEEWTQLDTEPQKDREVLSSHLIILILHLKSDKPHLFVVFH